MGVAVAVVGSEGDFAEAEGWEAVVVFPFPEVGRVDRVDAIGVVGYEAEGWAEVVASSEIVCEKNDGGVMGSEAVLLVVGKTVEALGIEAPWLRERLVLSAKKTATTINRPNPRPATSSDDERLRLAVGVSEWVSEEDVMDEAVDTAMVADDTLELDGFENGMSGRSSMPGAFAVPLDSLDTRDKCSRIDARRRSMATPTTFLT